MPASRPLTRIAELTYHCPLHCPYFSNPLDIGAERYGLELETEHWTRVFGEARRLGILQRLDWRVSRSIKRPAG